MEQSPSLQANSYSTNQEIHRLLWNGKFITVFKKAYHLSLY